jgi:hypothetical protein
MKKIAAPQEPSDFNRGDFVGDLIRICINAVDHEVFRSALSEQSGPQVQKRDVTVGEP